MTMDKSKQPIVWDDDPIHWMNTNINSQSKTFCGAKWFNATIWLGNGMTASCHHPPPHKIDVEEVRKNPSALHNTTYKKLVRKEMQQGIQTKECEYCWKMENLNKDLVSDRYHKSKCYSVEDMHAGFKKDWREDIVPQRIEIAFDNNCNFACSYCNAGFSTKWAHDINTAGAYKNLISDGWGAFAHNGKWAQPYGLKNEGNPYLDAFWKWWESDLQFELRELRVTGGEATMSKDFWQLVDWFMNNQDSPANKMEFSVNTNLGIKKDRLQKLCDLSKVMEKNKIFTSNESVGAHAEYIRDGMDYNQWLESYNFLAEEGNFELLHIMMTLNGLCLASLDQMLEMVIELRQRRGNVRPFIDTSYNILRFPSFQSITTLPDHVRKNKAEHFKKWLEKHKKYLYEHEISGWERTITYIEEVQQGHSVRDHSHLPIRQNDFYNFYRQYDKRRNKDFEKTFADWPDMLEWYDTLKDNTNRREVPSLEVGDAVEWGKGIVNKVMKKAKEEGLIGDNT